MSADEEHTGTCMAGVPDEKGRGGCRWYDPLTKKPYPAGPLCDGCLEPAESDIRKLVWDYRDLEQHLPPSLGAWGDGQPKGKSQPLPLNEHVMSLQRDIWWLATAWEDVLRDVDRLSMVGDWSKRRRDGLAVQQAMVIIEPRVRLLARLGPCEMWAYPGHEGATEVEGWQGVLDLAKLHQRARAALGLTQEQPELLLAVLCRGCDRRSTLTRVSGSDEVVCSKCSERYSGREYADWVGLDAAQAARDEAA